MTFLQDSYKETGSACDKVRSPEETLSWVRGRFAGLGVPILQKTERIDKDRLGIPVYVSLYTSEASRLTGFYKQMGKGVTPVLAETSAVMELVERFSLFHFNKKGSRVCCRRSLLDGDALPVRQMLKALHPQQDYDDAYFSRAEEIIDLMPFEWVRAYNPVEGKQIWLPWNWFWPINEYNGSASGNSMEEASVQALSEVVERHVCSLISYDALATPTIDPASLKDPTAVELLRKFTRCGVEVILKDFSLGFGIPTVGAIAWDVSTFPDRSEIVYTAGTAPSPYRALIRALTEVAQLAGDFDTEGIYAESGLPKFASLNEASYVLESPLVISIDSLPDCNSDNFRREVEQACRSLRLSDLDPFLVDITCSELDVPAVYAVIPGNQFRDRTRGLDVAFHCARAAASLSDPSGAQNLLHEIDRRFPARFDVAFYRGHVFEQMGEYGRALECYERALDLNPDPNEVASIYCHRGSCYKEMESYDEALLELERSRELNPGLKEVHNLIGYCYFRKGEHLNAIEAFETVISLDPGSAVDYANIAANLRLMGMKDAAVTYYDMALELDPGLEWASEHRKELLLNG